MHLNRRDDFFSSTNSQVVSIVFRLHGSGNQGFITGVNFELFILTVFIIFLLVFAIK
jgi:hypothetical protein